MLAITDHATSTGHNIKWDHFKILATGHSDIHRRIKELVLIENLKPSFNENVGSEKVFLYYLLYIIQQTLDMSVYYR